MDEDNELEWVKAKKDDDMLNLGRINALNDNKKTINKKKKDTNLNTVEDNLTGVVDLKDDYYEDIKTNKIGLISIVVLAILLFIAGIFIGQKFLEIDERPVQSYKAKEASQKNDKETINSNRIVNKVEDNILKTEDEDEEENPIIYAKYRIEEPNDNNKECSISFGKAKNFSISLGKNNAYIYGEYHIDGNIITCNAITWRNAERQESINSTIKFKIIDKKEIQVSEVNIFDGTEALDQELINLDGLRTGIEYVN